MNPASLGGAHTHRFDNPPIPEEKTNEASTSATAASGSAGRSPDRSTLRHQLMATTDAATEELTVDLAFDGKHVSDDTIELSPSAKDDDLFVEAFQKSTIGKSPDRQSVSPRSSLSVPGSRTSSASDISEGVCPSPFTSGIAHRIYSLAKVMEAGSEECGLKFTVDTALGKKSRAFSNIAFSEGGGCVINYVKREMPTEAKLKELLAEKQKAWLEAKVKVDKLAAEGKSVQAMKPYPENVEDLRSGSICKTVKRSIELHPSQGIHGEYRAQRNPRGSYVRIKEMSGEERRFSRHGWFDSRETYNKKPLPSGLIRPASDFTPNVVPPIAVKENAPTLQQANEIFDCLFQADKEKIKEVFLALSDNDANWDDITAVAQR